MTLHEILRFCRQPRYPASRFPRLLDGDRLVSGHWLYCKQPSAQRTCPSLLVLRCLAARDWVAVFVRGPDRTRRRRIDRPAKHRRGVMVIQAYAAGAAAAAAPSAAAGTKGKSHARPLRADVLLIERRGMSPG